MHVFFIYIWSLHGLGDLCVACLWRSSGARRGLSRDRTNPHLTSHLGIKGGRCIDEASSVEVVDLGASGVGKAMAMLLFWDRFLLCRSCRFCGGCLRLTEVEFVLRSLFAWTCSRLVVKLFRQIWYAFIVLSKMCITCRTILCGLRVYCTLRKSRITRGCSI
jgi:hypothetical protein